MNFRRSLWLLLGLDPELVRECSPRYQRRYTRTGLMLALIALSCLISGAFAFYLITDYILPAVPFGIVWAWMVINLYRLTLVTVGNKFILPGSKVRFPLFSMLIRIVFLGMLAFFIAKPLEIMFFNGAITPLIEMHKEETIHNSTDQKGWIHGNLSAHAGAEPHYYEQRVRASGYFIQRITILQETHPYIEWYTAVYVLLFLMPFLRQIRRSYVSEYEQKRAVLDQEIVESDYAAFKLAYEEMLKDFGEGKISWFEKYADPPFNTELKRDDRKFNLKGSLKSWIIEPE